MNAHRSPREDERLADSTLLALDNIAVDLPLAGLGSRTLAALLDYLILFVVLVITLISLIALTTYLSVGGGWVAAIIAVLMFLVQWAYFLAQEVYWDGRTVGKMAAKLRVVGAAGGKAPVAGLVVRNLIRQVDMLTGIPAMALDRRSRRLGDMAAGTLVIHDRPPRREVELHRLPPTWGAAEVAIAESLLARIHQLEAHRADHLALRLLRRMHQESPELLADVPRDLEPIAALGAALRAQDVGAAG